MSKTTIILNPWAGRGKAGRRQAALEEALRHAGIAYTLLQTTGRGHATELAREAVQNGCDVVIAIGGDGTLNETVNGVVQGNALTGRRAAFGVIPLGTGSDFVKVLENVAADDIAGGIQRIIDNRRRPIDLGRVEVPGQVDRFLLNAVGVGFDAQAAAEALKFKRITGWAVYYLAILKALLNYKAFPMKIHFNEEVVERRMMFATIANGRCQGAGFWLTPDAHIDDGQMDMCMVDMLGIVKVLRYIPLIQKAAHTNLPEVRMVRTDTIHITCENDLPVAIDGEVVSTTARDITVTACPGIVDLLH